MCRLRRSMAGRATSFAQIERYLRPCWGRLPLLGDGGARLWWQRARQPTNAAANIWNQRAVAASTIEVLRTESIGGGGGFAAEGALRLPIRAAARLFSESSFF